MSGDEESMSESGDMGEHVWIEENATVESKKRRRKSKNKNTKVVRIYSAGAYRCTLHSTFDLLREFTLENTHRNILKKFTPFWEIIDAMDKGKRAFKNQFHKKGRDITNIISYYNGRDFNFGNETYLPTEKNAREIFGIRDGEVKIDLDGDKKLSLTPFVKRVFIEKTMGPMDLKPNLIQKKILDIIQGKDKDSKTSIEDVARLLTFHLLATAFVPLQNSSLAWGYICIVDDLEEICKYNWSELILQNLLKSLNEIHTKNKRTS